MLGFDPRSFIVISTCIAAMCAFICFALRRGIPADIRGLSCWGSACIVLVLSSLLFVGRGYIDILYSSYSANIAVVVGVVLMYASIRRFCDLAPLKALYVGLPVLAALLLIWPTFISDDYRTRLIVIGSINAGLFIAAAAVILRDQRKFFAEYFTSVVFAATGLVSLARSLAAIASPQATQPLSDTTSIQHVYLATFAFSLSALSVGFILMVTKRLQVKLEDAAFHDGLTGIATRWAFEARARIELARGLRAANKSSLLMIDLDDFKKINDVHGHHGGDLVLKEFVRRTATVLREHDLFGRYGGEEFIVLLPDTDHSAALRIATRICHAIGDATESAFPAFTTSIGVTTGMPTDAELKELVAQADKALYRAKAAGKNRVESHCEMLA